VPDARVVIVEHGALPEHDAKRLQSVVWEPGRGQPHL
jgi:hypothetical protein